MAGLTHASPIVDVAVPLEGRPRRISPGFEAWRKFRRHRMAVASVVILALLTVAVLLAPPDQRNRFHRAARLAIVAAPVRHRRSRSGPPGEDAVWRTYFACG